MQSHNSSNANNIGQHYFFSTFRTTCRVSLLTFHPPASYTTHPSPSRSSSSSSTLQNPLSSSMSLSLAHRLSSSTLQSASVNLKPGGGETTESLFVPEVNCGGNGEY